MVYVALSRATSLQGLYLTNKKGDHTFHHARGKVNSELSSEFRRLENHKLETIGDKSRQFLDQVVNSPTALSLLTFNVQSLRAHVDDISTDSVLSQVKIMALSETWIENGENVQLAGYKPASQFKRNTVRAGGVAIYEREDSDLQATEYDLLKYEESTMQVKQMATAHDAVGDICAIQTTINGERAILVNVYITPNSNMEKIQEFFVLNMMAYSPKVAGLFKVIDKYGYYKIPMILGGDVNIDLKSDNGKEFLEFLQENWHLQLNNDPAISTTRNNTCIDGVFTRNIDQLQTQNYISYFSHHKPLLSIAPAE